MHLCGFSPVCLRMCTTSMYWALKGFCSLVQACQRHTNSFFSPWMCSLLMCWGTRQGGEVRKGLFPGAHSLFSWVFPCAESLLTHTTSCPQETTPTPLYPGTYVAPTLVRSTAVAVYLCVWDGVVCAYMRLSVHAFFYVYTAHTWMEDPRTTAESHMALLRVE